MQERKWSDAWKYQGILWHHGSKFSQLQRSRKPQVEYLSGGFEQKRGKALDALDRELLSSFCCAICHAYASIIRSWTSIVSLEATVIFVGVPLKLEHVASRMKRCGPYLHIFVVVVTLYTAPNITMFTWGVPGNS